MIRINRAINAMDTDTNEVFSVLERNAIGMWSQSDFGAVMKTKNINGVEVHSDSESDGEPVDPDFRPNMDVTNIGYVFAL